MSTRFFSPPLALSLMLTVLIFSEAGIREKGLYLAVVPLALYAFSFSHESVEGTINGKGFVSDAGISDERGLYYARTGLQRASLFYPNPRGEWLPPGVKGQKVYLAGRMGVEGYNAGPTLHIIDKMSLTDPLLARLPSSTRGWRIAHLVRPIPPGYFQTWQNDENKIEDPGLHEYYEHLKELTQAPLFGWNRFKEIFLFNFGYYDSLLESYLNPKGLTIKIEQINGSRSGQYIVGGGIDLMLDGLAHASHVELLVSDRHVHDVVFYREGVKLHTIETGPPLKVQENRGKVDVEVPSEVTKAGFDRVAIKDAGPVQYETDQSPFLYGIRLF